MGFPMTVERVVNRNRLDATNHNLMDDLRRLAEDAVRLATPSPAVPAGLDELRALSDAATPGPWVVGPYDNIDWGIWTPDGFGVVATTSTDSPEEGVSSTPERKTRDAAFIVAAVNYVRAAIARAYEAENP